MKKFLQSFFWLLKAWPFIAIIILGYLHYSVLLQIDTESIESFNNIVSSFTQILGGIIVLLNLNANLGIFKKTNIFTTCINWLKSCPIFKRTKPISGPVDLSTPSLTLQGEGHTSKPCTSLEEKIEEAQKQIDELRNILYRKEGEILTQVRQTEQQLKELIYNNTNKINSLNGLIVKTTIGGLQVQTFGVFLVIYGATFSYVPFFK